MVKKWVLGAVLGGLVVFVWMMFSWMVLPWHMETLQAFGEGGLLMKASMKALASVTERGIYVYPDPHDMSAAGSKPFVFAAITPEGLPGMSPKTMTISLVTQLLSALVITSLLIKTSGLTYIQRAQFVAWIGLAAGLMCSLPTWNWWNFPLDYVGLEMADLVIGWFLAGLVIGRFVEEPV